MLNNLDDENSKLSKVCEAFLDMKEYVKSADVLLTKINSLPSYDRPTQGEGAIICKSLGLLGSTEQTLEKISHSQLAISVLSCVQKQVQNSKREAEPLLKLLTDLFDIPMNSLPTTSPSKTQVAYPQHQPSDYEDANGKLTDFGKEMLKRGQYHCTKNVKFIGDSRFQPTRSFEIDWLVKLTSELSRRIEYSYGAVYDLRGFASRFAVLIMTTMFSFFLYFFIRNMLVFLFPFIALLFFLARG